ARRVRLDADAGGLPTLPEPRDDGRGVRRVRGKRVEHAVRSVEDGLRSRRACRGQPRRDDPGLRCEPGVELLGGRSGAEEGGPPAWLPAMPSAFAARSASSPSSRAVISADEKTPATMVACRPRAWKPCGAAAATRHAVS